MSTGTNIFNKDINHIIFSSILLVHFWAILKKKKNSSYVSSLSVCMVFLAGANKVEGTMSWLLGTNGILA